MAAEVEQIIYDNIKHATELEHVTEQHLRRAAKAMRKLILATLHLPRQHTRHPGSKEVITMIGVEPDWDLDPDTPDDPDTL
jgi:hypothetical protein